METNDIMQEFLTLLTAGPFITSTRQPYAQYVAQ